MNLVLLYDTNEADFARDVLAFLQALGLSVKTVVGDPNRDQTLSDKERRVLDEAEGMIFLLTPGCERNGVFGYASPSVCEELGKAGQRFKDDLDKVVYLADSEWKNHATFQKTYIPFVRTDHRSMVQAFRDLVMELRDMGAFAPTPKPKPQATIAELADRVSNDVKAVCKFIAEQDKAVLRGERLDWFMREQLGKNPTQMNLLRRELLTGWIQTNTHGAYYGLTNWGFNLVKHELEKPPPPPSAADLARFLLTYGPLMSPPSKKPDEA